MVTAKVGTVISDKMMRVGWGEPGGKWAGWGCRNEEGSWFHRYAYSTI